MQRYVTHHIVLNHSPHRSGCGCGYLVLASLRGSLCYVGTMLYGSIVTSAVAESTSHPPCSTQASYEFTTLTCIPGNIEYRDARIQLLDLPGIIEGCAVCSSRFPARTLHLYTPIGTTYADANYIPWPPSTTDRRASGGKGRGKQVIAVARYETPLLPSNSVSLHITPILTVAWDPWGTVYCHGCLPP